MAVLENLEPKRVFYFFEEISKIPHGSGNIEKISDYLVEFAKTNQVTFFQDDLKNVIMIKEATPGYENQEPIIIQGHMDMVCVKKPDCTKNMEIDPLELAIDGDYIYAKGTSLGGDDGIAVAYALALLEAKDLKHPRLEVVITVDEETGMEGATGIDLSMLKGNQLLNIDSEEEGFLLTSCAGGARVKCVVPINYVNMIPGEVGVEITVSGLLGGHSGVEIHKKRANANFILGQVLNYLKDESVNFSIMKLNGGVADNAIPANAKAMIAVTPDNLDVVRVKIQDKLGQLKKLYEKNDPDLEVSITGVKEYIDDIDHSDFVEYGKKIDLSSMEKILFLLKNLPDGVQFMSENIEGLVETSLNMGIMKQSKKEMLMEFAVRSSVGSSKKALMEQLEKITKSQEGYCEITGEYPAWEYRKNSPIRDKMVAVYQEMYGKKPELMAIHAGLECGILAGKIPNMDGVSFGPDMKDIHTAEERLSISSTKRTWEYLLKILETK